MLSTIFFLLIAVFVAYAEGAIDGFTAWNVTPLIASCYLILKALHTKGNTDPRVYQKRFYMAVGFGLLSVGAVLLGHLVWMFDWGRLATGSSTAGLFFVFLPVYAFFLGLIGYLLGWLAFKFKYSGS